MADGQLWEPTVGGHFVLPKRSFWPGFFSRLVARLHWAIDLAPDARAWPMLPAERRRLTTLLAGFCVAEDAVSEHLAPFAELATGHDDGLAGELDFLGLLPAAPR